MNVPSPCFWFGLGLAWGLVCGPGPWTPTRVVVLCVDLCAWECPVWVWLVGLKHGLKTALKANEPAPSFIVWTHVWTFIHLAKLRQMGLPTEFLPSTGCNNKFVHTRHGEPPRVPLYLRLLRWCLGRLHFRPLSLILLPMGGTKNRHCCFSLRRGFFGSLHASGRRVVMRVALACCACVPPHTWDC